jgi:uncharacterized protein involved in type VI secretion and phage assembly
MAVKTTLKIDTKLGRQAETGDEGPLLLAMVQGIEGVSMPYAYDVTMYRHIKDGDLNPREMINTKVAIHMRGKTDNYTSRRGVFQTFEKDGTNKRTFEKGTQTDFRVFRARIVPSFKMLDYELRYRVFEQMTVLDIIKEVMNDFSSDTSFGSYVVTLEPDDSKFPKIPYCVQFNESSMNFLSRLMAEFNIWYYFQHGDEVINLTAGERMILGTDPASPINCMFPNMEIVYRGTDAKAIEDATGITAFQRCFVPARKRVYVSDFNVLDPTSTPRGDAPLAPAYDLLPSGGATSTGFEREVFPALLSNPNNTAVDPETHKNVMTGQAEDRIQDEETNVFSVQGVSKNPSLMAGRRFHVVKDNSGADLLSVGIPDGGDYLVTQISFSAYENTYGHTVASDIANWFDSPFRWIYNIFKPENKSNALYVDASAAMASGGLSNWVQNQNINPWHSYPPSPSQMNFGDTFLAGMNTSFIQALMQVYLISGTKDVIADHTDGFSNAFIAVPWDGVTYKILPGPDAPKPRVCGPHLAVVIGQDGKKDVSLGGNTDIYADGLGRVRVRFPWQRVVPSANGIPGLPDPSQTDPMQSDRRTCWVAVSEGWAGHNFGTQFLPRIGQEVIVSFLDGDPDRPIITGRRYNADRGYSNLVFPPDQVDAEIYEINDWATPAPSTDFRFTGLKTAATPQASGGKSRYHLMRYDDTYNCEQILMRSQGRLDVTAFAHSFDTTYGNKNVRVVKGVDKNGRPFGGNMYTTVDQEYDLHVGTNRYEQVEKDYELTVKGNVRADFEKNLSAIIKGDVSIGLNSLTIEATEKITLKVGQSYITIDHCEIYINAPLMIYENSPGPAVKGAVPVTFQNITDATLAEPGDQWNKRLTPCEVQGPPGGPAPPPRTVTPTPAPPCDSSANGVSCNFLSGGGSNDDSGTSTC